MYTEDVTLTAFILKFFEALVWVIHFSVPFIILSYLTDGKNFDVLKRSLKILTT